MPSLEEGKSLIHTEETHEKSHSDARELGQETWVVTFIDFQAIARVKNTQRLKNLLVPISWRLGQTNICQETLILPSGKAVDKMTSKGLFPAPFPCDIVMRHKFPWEHQLIDPQPFCGVIH